jgi:hypothetical protein
MDRSEPFLQEVRDLITDALRYWEWWRMVYNAVLVVVTMLVFLLHFPKMQYPYFPGRYIQLFLLAVGANVLYCLAYPVDLFVQLSRFRGAWRRYRWILFLTGTLIASLLAFLASLSVFSSLTV